MQSSRYKFSSIFSHDAQWHSSKHTKPFFSHLHLCLKQPVVHLYMLNSTIDSGTGLSSVITASYTQYYYFKLSHADMGLPILVLRDENISTCYHSIIRSQNVLTEYCTCRRKSIVFIVIP